MKISITFSAFATFFLAACSTSPVTVATNYDHAASFGKYKTYTLAPPKTGEKMAAISEEALRDTLRTQLAARGITEASGKKADLDVVRHVFIQEKVSVQQYTDWGYMGHGGWPYRYGYYRMWPSAPVTYTDVNQYGEGTLILDFVDARTKKLVFRGTAKAVVGGPQENAPKIKEAVGKIVAEFPAASAAH
ncbi:MAG TPA: DUF4136 domain-containing protein [Chthoniobacterales bacterium]|jgi:hypothetical protein